MSENHEIIDNSVTVIPETIDIRSLVHVIRGKQVLLDSDLALLYQVETKRLNERVKRNQERFPESFCFQLTQQEYDNLRSQIATSSMEYGGRRYRPFAFTEQGIAMLSAVLKSGTAIEVSIRIMNAFVEMRKFIASNAAIFDQISHIELKQLEYQKQTDERFDKVFAYIDEHSEPHQKLFFDGQLYDAHSFLVNLIKKAKKDIKLVDGYVSNDTLDMLAYKAKGVHVTIYTYPSAPIKNGDISTFQAQYPTLDVKRTKLFHDRFLILDDQTVYHIGASLKDAGAKSFALSLFEEEVEVKSLLNRLHQIQ